MSFNDGWRAYEDVPEKIEKRNILNIAKIVIEKQLEKQQKKVNQVSENVRQHEVGTISIKRRITNNRRLSDECSARDVLERRLDIIKDWMTDVSNK